MIVLDASVLLDLLLRTDAAAAIEARIFAPDETMHAPELVDIELVQVLRRYAANRLITPAHGSAILAVLAEMPLERHSHEPLLPRMWELRGNLTAYDAAYVALAEGLSATLLTRDRKMAAAPGHRAHVLLIK